MNQTSEEQWIEPYAGYKFERRQMTVEAADQTRLIELKRVVLHVELMHVTGKTVRVIVRRRNIAACRHARCAQHIGQRGCRRAGRRGGGVLRKRRS